MTPIWRVFRYELGRNLRRRGYLFVSIGIPILALVIFFAIRAITEANAARAAANPQGAQSPIGEDSPLRNIRPSGIVDLSGLIKTEPDGRLLIRYENEEAARAALQADEIGAYYVVAADYLESGKIDVYFARFYLNNINNTPVQALLIQNLTRGRAIDPNVIARLQQDELSVRANIVGEAGKTQETNQSASMVLVYVFALLLAFTAFTTSGYLMQSVVEEKETRMVEILLSSVRPRELLAGKFLAMSLLGLMQMALWVGVAVFILRQIVGLVPGMAALDISSGQLAIVIVYFILGYLLFGAAYAAIGALATNMREGPQMAVLITLPAAVPYYFLAVFATSPNGPLPVFLSIFPITAPLSMVMRASITEVPVGELIASIVLLSLTILLFIWLAGRLFRVNTLLSGQPFKLKDIVRLVRENV